MYDYRILFSVLSTTQSTYKSLSPLHSHTHTHACLTFMHWRYIKFLFSILTKDISPHALWARNQTTNAQKDQVSDTQIWDLQPYLTVHKKNIPALVPGVVLVGRNPVEPWRPLLCTPLCLFYKCLQPPAVSWIVLWNLLQTISSFCPWLVFSGRREPQKTREAT